MEIKDKFTRAALCGLLSILQVVGGQCSDLKSQNRALKVAEPNAVVKLRLGPSERIEDRIYRSNFYLKSIKNNNYKKLREKLIGLKHGKQPVKRKTDHQEIFKWNTRKGNTVIEKRKPPLEWDQSNRPLLLLTDNSLVMLHSVLKQINDICYQLKLKTLSHFLANLKAQFHEVEKTFSFDPFEKFFKNILLDYKYNDKIKTIGKNKSKVSINNKTCSIQNRIENIFVFNLLLRENNSKFKEANKQKLEIFSEYTGHKMNDLLEKTVNNLNEDEGILQDNVSAFTPVRFQKNQMDFLKQLQRNFSRMFQSQNVTLKHINQISKIVDFVERYHGIVSDLKSLSTVKSESNFENTKERIRKSEIIPKKLKAGNKILLDDEFDIFESEDYNENAWIRRNRGADG